MAVSFLTNADKRRLDSIPGDIHVSDLSQYFTLSASDFDLLPSTSSANNQMGFALQLCLLRFVGYFPGTLTPVPLPVLSYLADQLGVAKSSLDVAGYGNRGSTRVEHQRKISRHLCFTRLSPAKRVALEQWLAERALEHDKPTLLFDMVCEKLLGEKIIRPGVTVVEKMVGQARNSAVYTTYETMRWIVEKKQSFLDSLLVSVDGSWRTEMHRLKTCSATNSAAGINESLEKLRLLYSHGVHRWDVSEVKPNRLRHLYELAKRSTNQAINRSKAAKKYPMLIAFTRLTVDRLNDEVLDMFDQFLLRRYGRAKKALDDHRASNAKSINEKLFLFQKISEVLLDQNIDDTEVRKSVFGFVPEEELNSALLDAKKVARPLDDNFLDFFSNFHSSLRTFLEPMLSLMNFRSTARNDSLLKAVRLVRKLLRDSTKGVPQDAPIKFIPKKWQPYIHRKDGSLDRKYYEMCTLWQLRGALRSGDIFIDFGRRYADPETYLLPKREWKDRRTELLEQMRFPSTFAKRFRQRQAEVGGLLKEFDTQIRQSGGEPGDVRIDNGKLVVPRFNAFETPDSVNSLRKKVSRLLPRIELPDLLVEVDTWTNFLSCFSHVGRDEVQTDEVSRHLYATILAQACNIGSSKMAQASKLPKERLIWTNNWFLREETIKAGINCLVDHQFALPLAQFFGGGTLSSSDGQRFPVPVKARNATALPRYFGYRSGVTLYSWTSDQFSQYGSKVMPATVRDAPYVLDAICDNETELEILEHTTDTAGYTELVFGLFDLLGMKFSPRIRDIGDQRLYRVDPDTSYGAVESAVRGILNKNLIFQNAEILLRIAGSLKSGSVTASLLISKYLSYPRENSAVRALKEWGRLIKTVSILEYILDDNQQRRITAQLNKGEAIHDLRKYLRFADEGEVRLKDLEDQSNQAGCLTLVTNAVIVWNTVYMWEAIEHLRSIGEHICEEDISHLSPCRFEHINRYGNYLFQKKSDLSINRLHPLRIDHQGF